ncbi:MAG: PLP-dependent aspartate aminotransferase family protein [Candidatus Pacebacteria bacterium]|nr:PLP-dependent aspartate aminotransferase family protein [Candidatus Paceibacterota bacterium]
MSTKTKDSFENKSRFGFGTLAIHAGETPDAETGAVAPVIVRSKTFAQKRFGKESEYQYSRGKNPTRDKLIEKLEALEGGGTATVFGSGLAAEAAFFLTLSPGDHVLLCQEVYGGTFRLLDGFLSRFGITYDFADFSAEESIWKGIKPNTKYLFVETPTNPSLHIIDLALVAKVSKKACIPFVVDATFSPPCTTKAFEYGAETVIHSLSKYIAGHNDILGGAVITKNTKLAERINFLHRTLGAVLSPDECYRVLQGVKTLELRWKRVSETALTVAQFLKKQKVITKVFYPGLLSHAQHSIAKKQHQNGFGGVVSFELREHSFKKLKKFVDTVRAHSPIIYGESLASPETILAYPPLMSHKSLPKNVRESLGITDGFFRLSVGFEDVKDILEGLRKGLAVLN